eukprot:gene4454-4710_t
MAAGLVGADADATVTAPSAAPGQQLPATSGQTPSASLGLACLVLGSPRARDQQWRSALGLWWNPANLNPRVLSPAGAGNAGNAGGLGTAGGTLDSLEALLADKDLLAGVFMSPAVSAAVDAPVGGAAKGGLDAAASAGAAQAGAATGAGQVATGAVGQGPCSNAAVKAGQVLTTATAAGSGGPLSTDTAGAKGTAGSVAEAAGKAQGQSTGGSKTGAVRPTVTQASTNGMVADLTHSLQVHQVWTTTY